MPWATMLPEVEDRDPVGDLEDVVEVVRDHHHRHALAGQPLDQVEHLRGLRHAQRGGRLVHDDQLGLGQHGLGDRHRLALTAGQRGDGLADRADRRDVQSSSSVLRAAISIASSSSIPRRSGSWPEEHVLDDVQVVAQRQVLVDRRDARVPRRPSGRGGGPACPPRGSRRRRAATGRRSS